MEEMIEAFEAAAKPPRPAWPGHKEYGKGRIRKHTRSDEIAFRKRVAKRRAKKGYK